MNLHHESPSKKQIACAFGRKAVSYEHFASVQKELLQLVSSRIEKKGLKGNWVDLGCGTGVLEKILSEKEERFRITGVDLSYNSLKVFKERSLLYTSQVQSDIEKLPFRPGSIDGAVICSVLQWLRDIPAFLKTLSGLLKNGSSMVFSIFTIDSFRELISVRRDYGLSFPVNLMDQQDFRKMLPESGFFLEEHVEYHAVKYFPDAMELLRSLSSIGSTIVSGRRLSRSELWEFCRLYEDKFKTSQGIPLTYNAMVGTSIKKENI